MTATPPSSAPQGYPSPTLRAPDGTPTGTVWIWLFAILPVVQFLASIPLLMSLSSMYSSIFGSIDSSGAPMSDEAARQLLSASLGIIVPAMWLTFIGYLLTGIGVLLGGLDWRELRRRGVPKPFHWAWGFFAFAGAGTLVYLIGRSVVVRKRTGQGLAPLWAGIAVYVALVLASIMWSGYLVATAISAISVR